jgi:hypothetical protein
LLFALVPGDERLTVPAVVPLDFFVAGFFAAVSLWATAPTDKKQKQASAPIAPDHAVAVIARRFAPNGKPSGCGEMPIPASRATKAGIAHHPV